MKLKVNAVFNDVKENVRRDVGEIFEATATRFKELEKKLPGFVEKLEGDEEE